MICNRACFEDSLRDNLPVAFSQFDMVAVLTPTSCANSDWLSLSFFRSFLTPLADRGACLVEELNFFFGFFLGVIFFRRKGGSITPPLPTSTPKISFTDPDKLRREDDFLVVAVSIALFVSIKSS